MLCEGIFQNINFISAMNGIFLKKLNFKNHVHGYDNFDFIKFFKP